MKRETYINKIIARDAHPPMYKGPYRRWLGTLTDGELKTYLGLVKKENPRPPTPGTK